MSIDLHRDSDQLEPEEQRSEQDAEPSGMEAAALDAYMNSLPRSNPGTALELPGIDLFDTDDSGADEIAASGDESAGDSRQEGEPESDNEAQTEFESVELEAGLPEEAENQEQETDALAENEALASENESETFFCAADDPVPIDQANQANDAASAINLASGGRYGNNIFFSPSAGALGLLTGVDINPLTIAGYVQNAWSGLSTTLGNALSGTRPADFRPMTGPGGGPAVVAIPTGLFSSTPTVNMNLNGRNETISMNLPGFNGHAVALVTDGQRVLAIDPRSNTVWQLQQNTLFGFRTGFSWSQLPKR